MVLSQKAALETARNILTGQRVTEATRLQRIYDAMHPKVRPGEFTPSVQIPVDAPPLMRELARKATSNYLPLVVKTYRQVIKADGYYTQSDQGATDPWLWWQRNRMDSRQTGLVDNVLTYGAAFGMALPGTYGRGAPGPAISLFSPRVMTALYQDPNADEWPMLALGRQSNIVTLVDEEAVYRFGVDASRFPSSDDPNAVSLDIGMGSLTFIDYQVHGMGVCPVVRYTDRNLLAGEESFGIVEPLMVINERITETTFQAMVIQYTQAFMQRYVLGWVPKNEEQELKAGAARIWYIDEDPADVRVDQLPAGQVDLTLRNASIRDLAASGQLPAQSLGIDGISNISDATLAGLEAAKNREVDEISTSLGESHEQLLRLCAFIDGNQAAADDYGSEIRWRELEARSFAQTVDGLMKLVSQGLPMEIALEDVPGMSGQKLERTIKSMRSQMARQNLANLRAAADATTPPPGAPL